MGDKLVACDVTVRVWCSFHIPESEMEVTVYVDADDPDPDFKALAAREVRRRVSDGVVQKVIDVRRC